MGGLRDILRRAFGNRSPEVALAEFKEKLHHQINTFKDSPESRAKLQEILHSVLNPLQYFNALVVRPSLEDPERLKALAKRYGVNKVELKRVFKLSLEFEEQVQRYFQDRDQVEQLIISLRKIVNVLDEQLITEIIDAMDYHIDYGKIEKAYLDYQFNLQKAYNIEGLNQELKGIVGSFLGNLKSALTGAAAQQRIKPSDQQPQAKMLEPELQNIYDRFRQEGFSHDEAMQQVKEKQDFDSLVGESLEIYHRVRREGRSHTDAMLVVQQRSEQKAKDSGAMPE